MRLLFLLKLRFLFQNCKHGQWSRQLRCSTTESYDTNIWSVYNMKINTILQIMNRKFRDRLLWLKKQKVHSTAPGLAFNWFII